MLTAHPTEARRRTTLVALRRCAILLARLGRPAADPVRGPRDPPPPARGDHAAVADLGPAHRQPGPARRGPDRDGVLRRHAVHGHPAALPGARCGARPADRARAGPGLRHRPDGDAAAAGRGVPAGRQLDRRGPRRQPGRDRGDHRAHVADPGRPRPARLRGGRDPADADDRGRDHGRARRRGRSPRAWPATPRTSPRPIASSAAASRTSRTASASGSSPSGCAGRASYLVGEAAPLTGRYASAGRPGRGAGRDQRRAGRRRPRPGRLGRGRGAALAARDVRVPPRLARGPPALGGPCGGARGDPRRSARRRPRWRRA